MKKELYFEAGARYCMCNLALFLLSRIQLELIGAACEHEMRNRTPR